MQRTRCDEKGRLLLRKTTRERYGEDFFVVEVPGEIILMPIPDDPLKDLEDLGKSLRGMSLKQIKERIRRRAMREVLDDLR